MRNWIAVLAAGTALTLTAGTALADWEATKNRAYDYHDQYGKVATSFDGDYAASMSAFNMSQGCAFSFSYSGSGSDISVTDMTPEGNSQQSQQVCQQGMQEVQGMAVGGITLSGIDVRQMLDGIAESDKVPVLSDSTGSTETYTITVNASELPAGQMPPGADFEIAVNLTFSKGSGQILGVTLEGEADMEETPQNPEMNMSMNGEIDLDTLSNGHPHLAGFSVEMNAEMTGGDSQVSVSVAQSVELDNVMASGQSAAAATAEAQATSAAGTETPLDMLLSTAGKTVSKAMEDIKAHKSAH